MKKKILCLAMVMLMTAGSTVTTFAEDFKSSSDWAVTFDGDKMDANFKASEMSQEVYRILPGDTMELQVKVKNTSEGETDWYMTNEILQSLEESQSAAEGGAYTYELTYTNPENEETVIYSSEAVGGEGSELAGEGLHQATYSLEEYFYLDRLAKAETGVVHLKIKLDGETQGNGYQDTLAKLQMNFAVEKVTAATVFQPGDPVKKVITKYITVTPKTGDPTNLMLICGVALGSGIILLVIGMKAAKKRK